MQNQSRFQSACDFVSKHWGLYRDRTETRRELASMSHEDIEAYAADCGLSAGRFRDLMRRGSHTADELLEVMTVLGIDEARLKAVKPGALRDMKVTCAECGYKSDCRASLRKGTVARDYAEFCENAAILDHAKPTQSSASVRVTEASRRKPPNHLNLVEKGG
jgi:hypothetical protein